MNKHWAKRCAQRGIEQDPDALWWQVRADILSGACDLVLTLGHNRYWRFHCDAGIFYAVTNLNHPEPITVFTQSMIRAKKFAAKKHRKGLRR